MCNSEKAVKDYKQIKYFRLTECFGKCDDGNIQTKETWVRIPHEGCSTAGNMDNSMVTGTFRVAKLKFSIKMDADEDQKWISNYRSGNEIKEGLDQK